MPATVSGQNFGTGGGFAVSRIQTGGGTIGSPDGPTPEEVEDQDHAPAGQTRQPAVRFGLTPRSDSFSIKTSSGRHLAYATCTMFKYLVSAGVVQWCKVHTAYHCDEPERLHRTMKLFRESGIH